MSLKIVSLASGSKGNCTLILSDTTAILCDAGVSFSRISESLRWFGLTPSMIDGVVITHEHSDHICALPKLSEKTAIYAHPKTATEIYSRQGVLKNYRDLQYYECGFSIGDVKVFPFRIPHDAAYPLGYTFECHSERVSVATDMGLPTVGVYNNIKNSAVVLIESNHDVEMLTNGNYAPSLKRRILGNLGHLSNDACAVMAERLIGSDVQTLVLGHLSENNNLPELAIGAVKGRLLSRGCNTIDVSIALQHQKSEVYEVK